tara:strand:- start:208 stop:450 length:243 start_codon:yes stop_codon:yes gene_type:complete
MREERMKHSSPEEEKISNHLGRERAEASAFQPVKSYDELDRLSEENWILKKNVKELQEQLQNAYVRIKELTEPKQMELDV